MDIMNVIRLAGKELRYFAYSPIGWVVLAIFVIQASYNFNAILQLQYQQLALGSGPPSFAEWLFTISAFSVFQQVIQDVYLYIPIITMAVFSRELQSGSIKLLMSSPVQPSEIVLGKFIGVAVFLSLFILGLLLLIAVSAAIVADFDWPATLPGLLGIYLLICTYAAIGIFVSVLTKHQVVAAVLTLAILFVLQSISGWLQTTPILNEITAWVSLAGRASTFRSGLIATPDVVYFMSVTAAFLAFSVIRVSAMRTEDDVPRIAVKVLGVTALAITVGWALSLPQTSAYIDTTYDRRNSLAPESVDLMERLDGPWEIVTYANFIDRMGFAAWPQNRIEDRRRYTYYRHINPKLAMRYELFYDIEGARDAFLRRDDGRTDEEVIQQYAERIGLGSTIVPSGPELAATLDVDLAEEQFRSFRVVRWNGREAVLRHFYDPRRFPGERVRAAALKRLIDGPVTVAVASGNGERSLSLLSPGDYERRFTRRSERFSLINHGFDFVEVDLSEPFPADVNMVLIADPRADYSDQARSNLMDFLSTGGNMALLLEPDSAGSVDLLLQEIGLSRGEPTMQTSNPSFPPDFVLAEPKTGVIDAYFGEENLTLPVAMDGSVSLVPLQSESPFVRTPMLIHDGNVLAYSLDRFVDGKSQRIVVFGDADVFSTANAERDRPFTNIGTAFDTFHWLTNGEYPVPLTERETIDREIRIGGGVLKVLPWLLIGLIPFTILGTGTSLLWSRRKR